MFSKALSYARQQHVALLALFVALGGTSYAATLPRNSVGPRQLAKNAVTSPSVKDGSLRSVDFRAGELPKGPSGPRGLQGPQGVAGAAGARGPSDAYASSFPDINSWGPSGASEIARQNLPAGQFMAFANFIVRNPTAVAGPFTCGLYISGQAGSVVPSNSIDYAQVNVDPGEQQTVSLLGPAKLSEPWAITLTCYSSGSSDGVSREVHDIDIGALQVGSLH